jgi:hypothetical protein
VTQPTGQGGVWQRRYWEHVIRAEADYEAHVDYIHLNPVRHGLVERAADWPWSSLHRWVREGRYPPTWGRDAGAPAAGRRPRMMLGFAPVRARFAAGVSANARGRRALGGVLVRGSPRAPTAGHRIWPRLARCAGAAPVLFKWKRQDEAGELGGAPAPAAPEFVPIGVVGRANDGGPALLARMPAADDRIQGGVRPEGECRRATGLEARAGVIEIDLLEGARVRVDGFVDARALARVLSALKRHA